MGDFLKAVSAERRFNAVTVSFNAETTYPFGAFVHQSGTVGHGTGETVELAVEAAIADLASRLAEAF